MAADGVRGRPIAECRSIEHQPVARRRGVEPVQGKRFLSGWDCLSGERKTLNQWVTTRINRELRVNCVEGIVRRVGGLHSLDEVAFVPDVVFVLACSADSEEVAVDGNGDPPRSFVPTDHRADGLASEET